MKTKLTKKFIKSMVYGILIFLFSFNILNIDFISKAYGITESEERVEINESNFPDKKFREYVKKFDKDGNDVLIQDELDDVKEIDISSKGIADLTGLKYFKKIEDLNCMQNQLIKLDISENTKLQYLKCGRNKLEELNLQSNVDLINLECSENNLTVLNLSKNLNLEDVACKNNKLTSLDLSKNENILDLDGDEQVYDIKVNSNRLEFDTSDFPGNFDINKIKDISKGSVDGNKLKINESMPEEVTYSYNAKDEYDIDVRLRIKYTSVVDFDTSGGIPAINPQNIELGGKISKLEKEPEKDGCKFLGWYNGDKPWNFDKDVVKKDLVLKAKWESIKSGWIKEGKSWYFYDENKPQKGWFYSPEFESWFYLDKKTGAMKTGWFYDNQDFNSWFYFDNNGFMKTGWEKVGRTWYYLNPSGAMATGWKYINGKWYLFDSINGDMKTGWQKVGRTWYYLNPSGAMATGWKYINGKWYLFDSINGDMKTGWQKIGRTWYYLNPSGAMATGWQKISNIWHKFASSGAWIR
ncbi:InlB B-repeat-containing protein [Eubacteriales bacterium KG127]